MGDVEQREGAIEISSAREERANGGTIKEKNVNDDDDDPPPLR